MFKNLQQIKKSKNCYKFIIINKKQFNDVKKQKKIKIRYRFKRE